MTTDQRIAEWARRAAEHTERMLRGRVGLSGCVACSAGTEFSDLCPSCWQRIADKFDPADRDIKRND